MGGAIDTMGVFNSLLELEDQLARQLSRAAALEREAGELARQLSENREAVCNLLKEMEGSE